MPSVSLRLIGDKKLAEEVLEAVDGLLTSLGFSTSSAKRYPYYTKRRTSLYEEETVEDDTKTRIYLQIIKKLDEWVKGRRKADKAEQEEGHPFPPYPPE